MSSQDRWADSILIKPCLPEVLFAEMKRLLDRSRALVIRANAAIENRYQFSQRTRKLKEL